MKVADGKVVGLEYRLHLGDGKVVDQSSAEEPLEDLHGGGQIVPGLEQAIEGMSQGESKKVVVASKDGYGEHDARGVQEVPRSSFPNGVDLAAGMQFFADTGDGERVPVTVKEVKPEVVVVDLNHPLAGKDLHFDVTVKSVREASAEEKQHGHAHGPDGHQD